jgi:3-hydroxyacyl-[acyl-carrier protein] dehydratase/trans-2-decenoyl-[acyl-carrier protein] isomerase
VNPATVEVRAAACYPSPMNPVENARAQSSYSREDLLDCANGRMFGDGNAQLPLPPMLLMDRITTITQDGGAHGKGYIEAEFDIDPSLWFFACHFNQDPVMPGSLGLDALWQMVGFFLGWSGLPGRGRALGCSEAKFRGQVRPYGEARDVQGRHEAGGERGSLVMGIGDGVLEVDGKAIYTATDLRVGLNDPASLV